MIDVSTAKSITLNGSDVKQIAHGGVVLWKKKTPIGSPLRVVNNVAGSQITFTLTRNGSPADIFIEYSTDNVNWNTWTETNGVRSMSIAKNGNLFLRGNNPNGINPLNNNTDYYSFNADKQYAMAGDICSLISHYEIDTLPYCAFGRLFKNSTTLYATGYMRLPATNLSRDCYSNMFYGCSGLINAPHVLPAISTSRGAYNYMFYGCTSLTTMPIIRTTDFGMQCCYDMFRGCSALANQWTSETPSIETTTTAISFTIASSDESSFYEMFRGCTSLVNASGITATKTTEWKSNVFAGMFSGCTALTSTPTITIGSLTIGTTRHCMSMFIGCTSLTSASNITLNATTISNSAYEQMFNECSALVSAPTITTSALTIGDKGLQQMFRNCTSLTTAPNLNISTLNSTGTRHCYDLFRGCSSLTDVTKVKLNATTLYEQSYHSAFWGCINLVTPPEIMATTYFSDSSSTTNGSFVEMFYNCSKLNQIKVHFTSWDNGGRGTKNWTYGTKSSGTFYKPSSLPSTKNASGNTSNPDYIPYDWTVVLNPCVDCTNWQQCGYVSEEECEFDLYGTLNQLVTGGLDTRQESGGTVYKLNVYIRTGVPGCTYTIREAGGSTHTYSGSGDNSLYNYVVDRVSLVNGKKHFYVNATKDGISTGEIHYAAYDYGVEIIE